MGDVAILIAYFNPVGYQSHSRKLCAALEAFHEAGLADDVFLVGAGASRPSWPNVAFWDDECAFLWHKERLLNIGADVLPDSYTHVVWADSDIIVGPDWAPAVRAAFKRAAVVQCFSEAAYRTETGARSLPRPGALCPGTGGVLGVCWGAERSLFTGGPGLFDLALVGGGDGILACELPEESPLPSAPWLADLPPMLAKSWSGPLLAELDQWRAAVRRWMAGKRAVAAEATVDILLHGAIRERQYNDRQSLLAGIDPGRHLVREPDRVFRWSAEGLADVEPGVRAYFHQRREDEVPPRSREPRSTEGRGS
jgi:hypothetical protein